MRASVLPPVTSAATATPAPPIRYYVFSSLLPCATPPSAPLLLPLPLPRELDVEIMVGAEPASVTAVPLAPAEEPEESSPPFAGAMHWLVIGGPIRIVVALAMTTLPLGMTGVDTEMMPHLSHVGLDATPVTALAAEFSRTLPLGPPPYVLERSVPSVPLTPVLRQTSPIIEPSSDFYLLSSLSSELAHSSSVTAQDVIRTCASAYIESPDDETMWYARYFAHLAHDAFVGSEATLSSAASESPFVITVLGLEYDACPPPASPIASGGGGSALSSGIEAEYYVIVWRVSSISYHAVSVSVGDAPPTVFDLLDAIPADARPVIKRKTRSLTRVTPDASFRATLTKLEAFSGTLGGIKLGLLYAQAGQTNEDEYYSNREPSAAFEAFLNLLGPRVRLKGYPGFSAQLDTRHDDSGEYTRVRRYMGHDVVFHVSTELQYDETDDQRIQRKRFIGNDIVVIVFLEGDAPFRLAS